MTHFIKNIFVVAGIIFSHNIALGQSTEADSLKSYALDELKVSAYGTNRSILESTASVGIISAQQLERFAPTTLTNAVNTLPGVRMEERSPGSYRFAVRGSMLRSPFGVRNVKFYYNNIPLTDVNGNTPLNILDFGSINRLEVIKGPGSSLYGAGTGGVVLLNSSSSNDYYLDQSVGIGRYGLQNRATTLNLGNTKIQYGHLSQEGYRKQSQMYRDAITFSTQNKLGNKGHLSIVGIYSDLFYQTPGGLNLAQLQADPTQARQPAGPNPGSESQNARISTKYFLLGGNYQIQLNSKWLQSNAVYLNTNTFANPFITNYEKREENGFGTRNTWQYNHSGAIPINWITGFEFQTGRSVQRNYDNLQGDPGPQQTSEDIATNQGSIFTQFEAQLPNNITFVGGLGYSLMKYNHENYFPGDYTRTKKSFDGVLMPRLALNKRFTDYLSITASVSRGFSPPTLQEVRPSAGGFRPNLEAETGFNQELTVRYFKNKLQAEVTAYHFGLSNTIVRRTNEGGAEYFINGGKTQQNGIEWSANYTLLQNQTSWVQLLKAWHTGNIAGYTFKEYNTGGEDLSGNEMPGVPKFTQNSGISLLTKYNISLHLSYQTNSKFYLNDLNTVESSPTQLFHTRATWRKNWTKKLYSELSASSEWVKGDIYSLGFDLNAFGNRFYNPAPKQNWHTGIKIGYRFK